MKGIVFSDPTSVTDEWLEYFNNEVENIKEKSTYEIESYMDKEILNPEVLSLSLNQNSVFTLQDDTLELFLPEMQLTLPSSSEAYVTGFNTKNREKLDHKLGIIGFFKKLKTKIKRLFCQIVDGLNWEEMNAKDILKSVLIGLIPFFAGGVGLALTPIVIGLVALLLKKGKEIVCPI